jgi:hypothetical protein
LGGTANDRGHGIAVDGEGNAVVAGRTASSDFPTTRTALATRHPGGEDGFVTKLNAKGSRIAYSTYLGGAALDFARGVALDARGDAYVAGRTGSPDFPATSIDTSSDGDLDAFVTKIEF